MSNIVLVEVEHGWKLNLGFHKITSDLPVQKVVTIADIVAIAKKYPKRAVIINTLPAECRDPKRIGVLSPAAYFEKVVQKAGLKGAVIYIPPPGSHFEPGFIHCVNLL